MWHFLTWAYAKVWHFWKLKNFGETDTHTAIRSVPQAQGHPGPDKTYRILNICRLGWPRRRCFCALNSGGSSGKPARAERWEPYFIKVGCIEDTKISGCYISLHRDIFLDTRYDSRP